MSLFDAAHTALMQPDPEAKVAAARDLEAAWRRGDLTTPSRSASPRPVPAPGRPDRPALVRPRELVQRRLNTPEGRAVLVHAVAHIEFNAINLALDAVYRFRDMPEAFYGDWFQVAAEEASHFSMLRARLIELGFDYGDFPAHNGLWEMAVETADDVLVRMALVPRVLEARGLDVTPGMIERLERAGDTATVEILRVILREEIGHVAIGSRWYLHACEQRGLDPVSTFVGLLETAMRGRVKPPFHRDARLQAGFSAEELDRLEALAAP
jgi:uncharacterized ferritin-like protein (DUF455 family)